MNIALIGYGKMGRAIEAIAVQKNHEIILKVNEENLGDFTAENLKEADVAIEFTGPHTAFNNITQLLKWKVPVVSGSTGWLEKANEAKKICLDNNGFLLYASNFSVGVNIFFEINRMLAGLMAGQNSYKASMEEIHHTAKIDAPSGTAITLAEQILEKNPALRKWKNEITDKQDELSIISVREDPAPGTHRIKYDSSIDSIEIIHTAHNRDGFAAGAVLAAEFSKGKKGVYAMKDVLGL